MARLAPDHNSFFHETDRLLALLRSLAGVAPVHRKLIAEIMLMRLSFLLENHLKLIFAKLSCGARYLDGSIPKLQLPRRSMAAALTAMKDFNRPRPRYPIWNDAAEIRENVIHVISANDHCISVMRAYASYITELRYIRNYIAHRNDGTHKNFRTVLRKFYGAVVPGVTSGTLLLSERVSTPPLMELHIRTSRILIKELLKAYPQRPGGASSKSHTSRRNPGRNRRAVPPQPALAPLREYSRRSFSTTAPTPSRPP